MDLGIIVFRTPLAQNGFFAPQTPRPPLASPGPGRNQSQIRVPGCRIRAWSLNFHGSPLPRAGRGDPKVSAAFLKHGRISHRFVSLVVELPWGCLGGALGVPQGTPRAPQGASRASPKAPPKGGVPWGCPWAALVGAGPPGKPSGQARWANEL